MTTADPKFAEGVAAFADSTPLSGNPYSAAQGSPTRVAAIAWTRGWRHAQQQAEIAEQESDGHFRAR